MRSLLLLSVVAGTCLVAYSCASTTSNAPLSHPPPPVAQVVGRPSSGAQSFAPSSVSEPMSLGAFRPLLSEPRYAAARIKHEAGDYTSAADLVRKSLEADPPAVHEADRHRFLLGRMLERAGQREAARDAFAAVGPGSALAPYAELGAARVELALGAADKALSHIGRAAESLPEAAGRRRLLADAALRAGARDIALREYRRLLQAASSDRDRIPAALALLGALTTGNKSLASDELAEALHLARLISATSLDDPNSAERARREEERLLAMASAEDRKAMASPSRAEQLARLRVLVEARRIELAQAAAASLPTFDASASEPEACEIEVLRGKLAMAAKRSSEAERIYVSVAHSRCAEDQRARALYAAGKAAQSGARHATAVKLFAELERAFPTQSVADDARLYGALSSLELGDEARFTDALSSMPDDYPDGDMLAEGCFRLALRRMEKQDYQSAERPLTRAVERLPELETARGGDFAGRERYFLARVQVETGERERGLAGYEALIRQLPLGYYARAAYSALARADAQRAARAIDNSVTLASREPAVVTKPLPEQVGFRRALELASVGELDWARAELALLSAESQTPELLFNAAVLYAKAGAVKLSSEAARAALGRVPPRWPAGDWLEAWKLAYPRPYLEVVTAHALKNTLPSSLIYAVIREESAFDADAESPADAYGLMQLILPTAKHAARPLGLPHDRVSLKRPSVNIPLGARVLGNYRDKFPNDPLLAIAAYNAGPGAAQRWLKERPGMSFDLWVELIPYVETRRYIKRVLGSAAVYAIAYQEAARGEALLLPNVVSKSSAP